MGFFENWFGSSTDERLLRLILANQEKMMAAQNIDTIREEKLMIKFDELTEEVSGIKGVVNSAMVAFDGLEAKIVELSAGMSSAEDQAKVASLAAELRATKTDLANAIATNPNPGASMGGAKDSTPA